MTTTAPTPAHLAGNFAPVTGETTTLDLPVTGAVPAELTGWYLRNGPNPHHGTSAHWFLGDGMVHGVRLDHGRATWYRNRWVRTRVLTDDARAYGPDGTRDLTAGPANTNVVRHGGRLLALVESALPYEITTDLETVGPYDFGGRLHTPMTAHPKVCPTTGEMHFFGYGGLEPPYLTYHRAGADGRLSLSRPIDVPAHTMMHDFSLTAAHVIFMDLPVLFSLDGARTGGMPYRWDDTYQARLGVLRRDAPQGEVRWYTIDPGYVFHTLNAHDDGDRIVMHVVRHEHAYRPGQPAAAPDLWRWTIDQRTGRVAEERLDDEAVEFPRIDDRRTGQPARYGFAVTDNVPRRLADVSAVIRYDLHTGSTTRHRLPTGQVPGEAVFVPAGGAPAGSADGWLLTFAYDPGRDASDLIIIDATDLAAPPLARIHLPHRVPFGFHGNWLPDHDRAE
ncbi:carotenoid cleavage dioxygenase [Actinoplanes sp. SE50]|uniref:carotenoid oxygenase family protein n=1 Tax=unclassified Actinoplanes TaxID=2626549 RepID=UPI00023EC844|nr:MULTISPECIES: carotenoid oxygenase family protein [unclassified Actinoplanes]AEV86476.1 carotenoid cleavage dioxygenase [Actinoplanes sp. SE50/110]ATO84874.1 carotenoid cleavage dioxygenase [Actinoplanes sp. SE50]SLM02283.1 carotenoid cleavage dioxygenase [Actinoplanes sp. SE50/110]